MHDELTSLAEQLRAEARALAERHAPRGVPTALWAEAAQRQSRRRCNGALAGAAVIFAALGAGWLWTQGHSAPGPAEARVVQAVPRRADTPNIPRITEIAPRAPDNSAPELFLISVYEAGGRRVIGTGVYLPGSVEELRLSDLSPMEQAAVRRSLPSGDELILCNL